MQEGPPLCEETMSEFSRIDRLPPYAFAVVGDLKKKLRQEGADIVDFSMGNPDLPTPKFIVDKLCEAARKPVNHRYSVSRGIPNLRKAVCDLYKRKFDVDLDPDSEAITTIGSKEGFAHLCLAMLNPGDVVLAPLFKLIIEFSDAWFWAYVVGFILLGISYYIFSSLLIYMCVTIGCIVAKKAKALIAILIYYAASMVMSTASYIIIPIGTYFAEAIDILGANANPAVSSLIWLAVLLCASACVLLLAVAEYKFILSRIENKLNLA